MSKENVTRRISIYVNGKEVENSLKGVDGEIQHVRNSLRKLVEGTEDYDKKKAELTKNLSQLTERQREYREELGLTKKAQDDNVISADNVKEAFSKIFVGLTSGDLTTAKEGFDEIKGSISGMVESALAFIATPLGATIAVLSGIAIGTKAIFDFNVEAEKAGVLIENLSGKTGQAVENIRLKTKSLVDTFGVSFDQLAGAVDNLVDTGAAKDELEALDKIKKGLLTAPDKNEFISGLEGTAVIAKQLGLDLDEVISLKKQIETTGVNPEATFGALEKATQRLQLGADGLRKKMSEALGAGFTDDVLAKVTTGQISVTKALELINAKSKEVGLNQTQQAELGKELFGKGATAAGGYAVVLDTVAEAIKKQKEPLNENQKALDELEKANYKVAVAQSELFRIKDFGSIWTNIKASAIDTLGSILEWIVDVKTDIQPLIDFVGVVFVNAWNALKFSVQVAFALIGGILKQFSNVISTTFNFVKKILQGDFAGALDVLKNGFIKLGNIVGSTFAKIKNYVIDGLKTIVDNIAPFLEAIGLDVDKIQKKLDSFKSKTVVLKTTPEEDKPKNNPEAANTRATAEELAKQKAIRDAARQKEIEANQRALDKKKAAQEKHDKEIADMAIALAKSKTDLAKAELDYFIANNRSKIDKEKQLTPEIIAEEIKRLDQIKSKQIKALDEKLINDKKGLTASSDQELSELKKLLKDKVISQSEFDELQIQNKDILKNGLKAIDLDYETGKQNLELQFLDTTTALKKQYEEQQKVLAAEQLKAENEIKIGQLNDEFAIKQETERQRYASEKSELDKRLKEGYITKTQYLKLLKIAEDNHAKANIAISRAERDARLSAYGELFGNIAKLLGENTAAGKAAALAQVAISQGLAIAKIWETESTLPSPFDVAAKVAGTAVAIANVVGAARQINSVKTPKFFYGGFNNSDGAGGSTGTMAYLGTDEYGKITGVTHDEEWVAPKIMTKSPKYAATFSWLENERKAIIGNRYFNGGETSTGTVTPYVASNTQNDDRLLNAINRLNEHLERGIQSKIIFGYKDAKEIQDLNRERENSNQFGIVNQ